MASGSVVHLVSISPGTRLTQTADIIVPEAEVFDIS